MMNQTPQNWLAQFQQSPQQHHQQQQLHQQQQQQQQHQQQHQQHQQSPSHDGPMPPSFSQAASQLAQLKTNLMLHHSKRVDSNEQHSSTPSPQQSPTNNVPQQQSSPPPTSQLTIQQAGIAIPFTMNTPTVTIDSDFVSRATPKLFYPPHQAITKLSTPYFSHIGTPIVTTPKYMVWSTPPGPLRIFNKMNGKRGFLKKHKGAVLDLKAIELLEGNQTSSCLLSIGSQDGAIICWKVGENKTELTGKGLFRIRREGMFRKALFSQKDQVVYALTDDGNLIVFDIQKVTSKDIVIENDDEFFESDDNKAYGMSKWTLPMIIGNQSQNTSSNTTVDDDDDAQDRIVDIALTKDESGLYLLTQDSSVILYDLRTKLVKLARPVNVDAEQDRDDNEDYGKPDPFSINIHETALIIGFDQNTTIALIDGQTLHQQVVHLPHENNESYHIYAAHGFPYMIISNRNGDQCYIYDFENPAGLLLIGIKGGALSCVAEMKNNSLGIFCLQPSGTSLVQANTKTDTTQTPPEPKRVTFELTNEQQQQQQQPLRNLLPPDNLSEEVNAEDFEKMLLKQHSQSESSVQPTATITNPTQTTFSGNDLFKQLTGQQIIPEPVPSVQQTQPKPATDEYLTKREFYSALSEFESRMMNHMTQLIGQFSLQAQHNHQHAIEHSQKQQSELLKAVSSTLTSELPDDLCEMMNQEIVPQIISKSGAVNPSQISKAVEDGVERVMRNNVMPAFEGAFEQLTHRITSQIAKGNNAQANIPTQTAHVTKEEQLLSVIDNLISQQQYGKALSEALSGSNLSILVNTLQRLKTDLLPEMDQPIILSLVQQLAYDLSWNDTLKTKMDWLEQSILFLEPTDDIVIYHGGEILRSVLQNLKSSVQQMSNEKKSEITAIMKRMKLMMHVVQNFLVEIVDKHSAVYL